MSQSLSHVIIHTVFSTKNREPFLETPEIREETFAFLGGVAKTLDCQPFIIGGHVDHVHLLTSLSRTLSQADFVKEVKRNSSLWSKEKWMVDGFAWQKGYGIFSVSESRMAEVKKYIANQEIHHHKVTFQDEFRRFLAKHNIPYDERYVWD